MTIQSANAVLNSTASLTAVTGFRNYQTGILDSSSGTVKPVSNSNWSSLSGSSWAEFNNYTIVSSEIRWTAPRIDLGEIKYFTLDISSDFDGDIYYMVHVSENGLFQGEESEFQIQNNSTNITAFYGRYVYVTAFLTGTELRSMTVTTSSRTVEYTISNVDTSSLAGSISNRTISLPRTVSAIIDISVIPRAATSYAVNLYVSDTATSEVLIPVIKDKSANAPKFALYGIDNDARNGIVDIKIKALPRQVMLNGQLTTVE